MCVSGSKASRYYVPGVISFGSKLKFSFGALIMLALNHKDWRIRLR